MDSMERTQPPLRETIVHRELAMGEEEQKATQRRNTLACTFLSSRLPGGTLLSGDTTEQRMWFNCKEKRRGGGGLGEKILTDDEYS